MPIFHRLTIFLWHEKQKQRPKSQAQSRSQNQANRDTLSKHNPVERDFTKTRPTGTG